MVAWTDGAPIALKGGKPRMLLALLALAPETGLGRAEAAALLWPDAPIARARDALRQCLRGLASALGEGGFDGLEADRMRLRIPAARLERDVDPILRCAGRGLPHGALLTGRDPFARLCAEEPDPPEGVAARIVRAGDAMRATASEGLAAALATADDPVEIRDLARALLTLDPSDEPTARRLMAAEAELGAPQRALSAYDALWRALDTRFGEEPSSETTRVLARIRSATSSGVGSATAREPVVDAPPVVEIAPFSSDGDGDLAEELRAAAAAALRRDGRVAPRLGVGFAGAPAARLRGRLVEGADGPRLSLLLTSEPEGLVDAALDAEPHPAAVARAARALADCAAARDATPNVAATRRAAADALIPDALARAAALAEAMGAQAPAAQAAATALAPALDGRPPTRDEADAARAAAERAVDADPLDPAARLALGWAALIERDFDASAEAFSLAAHLDPEAPARMREAALGLALSGRRAEAAGLSRAADALGSAAGSPLGGMLALALGIEPPEAAAAEPPLARAWRAAALARGGRIAAAADLARPLARRPGWATEAAAALPDRDAARQAALSSGLAAAAEALLRDAGG